MKRRTVSCQIEDIAEWHPQLFLDAHIAACVSVLMQYSQSPATLMVDCHDLPISKKRQSDRFIFEVKWAAASAVNGERVRLTVQSNPLVELAATAIGFVLVHRVLSLGQIEVTDHGDRADYRSSDTEAVLEISGTESLSQLSVRHRAKVVQALANPFGWDAYVIICGFSADGHRVLFSKHSQEEAEDA